MKSLISLITFSALAHAGTSPNILFILADDIGANYLHFSQHPSSDIDPPHTPTLDALAKRGVIYTNAWASPLSSPTRANLLTGQYGTRSGVTQVGDSLDANTPTLADYLKTKRSYSTAIIGKWHLSKAPLYPKDYGFDHFLGTMGGGVRNFSRGPVIRGTDTERCRVYNSTNLTNEALKWIKDQDSPWFCWLNYNAAHTPFHLPPPELHSNKNLSAEQDDIDKNPLPYYYAMIEAMDTEIGRLIRSMPAETRDRTIIIFMGDNGTERQLVGEARAKGSVYQGGIHVPLFITGAGITRYGVRDSRPICATDMFSTIIELAGGELPQYKDSYSFASSTSKKSIPHRLISYAESNNRRRGASDALTDGEYKLITVGESQEELYDLSRDYAEKKNLLSEGEQSLSAKEQRAYRRLLAEREKLEKSFSIKKSETK